MATVTHIIRSHYDPADRAKLECETGQRTDDQSDPWQTESSFSAQRRIRAAPTFVPAAVSYDERVPLYPNPAPPAPEKPQQSTSTAEWYRLLTAPSRGLPRPASAPTSAREHAPRPPSPKRHREGTTKNDWFIRQALRSAPATTPGSPAPSLADLLARDPPPMPEEGRYAPPVWLHIGPSNRGFGMLQRSGWREGEGLGAHLVRQARARDTDVGEPESSIVKARGDRTDGQNVPEVIDLTLSDSEMTEDAFDYDVIQGSDQTEAHPGDASHSMQRSLLTPLPTVLKADRLGIGLKAKTEGPHKQSKKRVTHNAAALAAHIRSAQEMRWNKAMVGKGKRGFAKIHKREEDRRKAMMAYLNE